MQVKITYYIIREKMQVKFHIIHFSAKNDINISHIILFRNMGKLFHKIK